MRAWHLWNEQTSRKVLEYRLAERPPEAARAFALASFAVHDAVVACWDAKYAYWAMRPFQVDPELKPLFPAPNHPSYPAAHACISTAAGYTLAALFPRDAESLRSLAKQAGDARMWGGHPFPLRRGGWARNWRRSCGSRDPAWIAGAGQVKPRDAVGVKGVASQTLC